VEHSGTAAAANQSNKGWQIATEFIPKISSIICLL